MQLNEVLTGVWKEFERAFPTRIGPYEPSRADSVSMRVDPDAGISDEEMRLRYYVPAGQVLATMAKSWGAERPEDIHLAVYWTGDDEVRAGEVIKITAKRK